MLSSCIPGRDERDLTGDLWSWERAEGACRIGMGC